MFSRVDERDCLGDGSGQHALLPVCPRGTASRPSRERRVPFSFYSVRIVVYFGCNLVEAGTTKGPSGTMGLVFLR